MGMARIIVADKASQSYVNAAHDAILHCICEAMTADVILYLANDSCWRAELACSAFF